MAPSRSAARSGALLRFLRAVLARFTADRGPSLAASLTYTTLLAAVPLLAIGLAVMTAFPVFEDFTLATQGYIEDNLLPPKVGETVLGYLREFSAGAARLTALGLAGLAVSVYFMMHTIETAFNAIWRVRRRRPLAVRMAVYLGAATLGPVLVGASLTTTSYFVGASLGLAGAIPGAPAAVLTGAQLAVTTLAFTLLYRVVPNRTVAMRHALLGGGATAVAFELCNRAFAAYVGHVSTYTLLYGAFAVVPLFLVWVYLSWAVTLFGAVLTAMLPEYGRAAAPAPRPPPPSLTDLLRVLGTLVRAGGAGIRAGAADARGVDVVPVERVASTLDALAHAGWAAQGGDGRWRLACDPDLVSIAAVHDSLDEAFTTGGGEAEERMEARVAARVRQTLDVPLRILDGCAGTPAHGGSAALSRRR
jgi:membrane protein